MAVIPAQTKPEFGPASAPPNKKARLATGLCKSSALDTEGEAAKAAIAIALATLMATRTPMLSGPAPIRPALRVFKTLTPTHFVGVYNLSAINYRLQPVLGQQSQIARPNSAYLSAKASLA
jgi:hypothetical protein